MATQIRGRKKTGKKKMARDPVCKMDVDQEKSLKTVSGGTEYFFCSEECRSTFEGNPPGYSAM